MPPLPVVLIAGCPPLLVAVGGELLDKLTDEEELPSLSLRPRHLVGVVFLP
jgi:hypothetical protein